jgi:cAMP-dependent protein kinase regulator
MSLPSSFKNEINALEREISKAQPKDVLQYCADFFHRRLASQRTEFLLGGHKSNGSVSDTMSNPFGDKSPFGSSNKNVNSINEEDEERDTFGSPTDPTTNDTGRSPFSTSSPFGAAAGGAAAGAAGGFGAAWAMGGNSDQDQQAPGKTIHPLSRARSDSLPQQTMPQVDAESQSLPNPCSPTLARGTGSLRNTQRQKISSLA